MEGKGRVGDNRHGRSVSETLKIRGNGEVRKKEEGREKGMR